jgi:hypothetical protein
MESTSPLHRQECAQAGVPVPLGGAAGKMRRNRKKILNNGNEPKNLLKAQELAFSRA